MLAPPTSGRAQHRSQRLTDARRGISEVVDDGSTPPLSQDSKVGGRAHEGLFVMDG